MPLKVRPPSVVNGITCNVWIADRDVTAQIRKPLVLGSKPIIPSATTDIGAEAICAKATIYSTAKDYSGDVEHSSGRHNASTWAFSKQTAVVVEFARPEFMNAMNRRER